jgi:predicted nucleic acid-binding protein
VGKAGFSATQGRAAIVGWHDTFPLIETSPAILLAAADLAVHHVLSIWDVVILSAAAAAGCRLLLSEDMQDGFTWSGVTIANPFATVRHPLLEASLQL